MFPPAAPHGHRHFAFRNVACGITLLLSLPLPAEYLYTTGFEAFTIGPDQWIGTEGWIGNGAGVGAHGIDSNLLPTLGKSAYLGFNQPTSTFTFVAKPFTYDPVAQGAAEIYVESLLGIEDSTNGKYDNFYLSFYNSIGGYLASILFSNHPGTYGIWRLDGLTQVDTTIDFITGELHLITASINHAANTWSAAMDGIPLFTNAPFTATGRSRDVGPVSYEWQLSDPDPANFGNNWLLVADLAVIAVPPGEGPFLMDTIGFSETGQATFSFTGEPGWNYQVEFSDNAILWRNTLPDSFFTAIPEPTQLPFTDPTPSPPPGRYYRVVRSVTP